MLSSWWLNQPIWKICWSKWIISPGRGENKKYLKPPPSCFFSGLPACEVSSRSRLGFTRGSTFSSSILETITPIALGTRRWSPLVEVDATDEDIYDEVWMMTRDFYTHVGQYIHWFITIWVIFMINIYYSNMELSIKTWSTKLLFQHPFFGPMGWNRWIAQGIELLLGHVSWHRGFHRGNPSHPTHERLDASCARNKGCTRCSFVDMRGRIISYLAIMWMLRPLIFWICGYGYGVESLFLLHHSLMRHGNPQGVYCCRPLEQLSFVQRFSFMFVPMVCQKKLRRNASCISNQVKLILN